MGLWRRNTIADQLADRHPVDAEAAAASVVRLHDHADDMSVHAARCGADPALELVADHSGAAADVAFRDVGRRGGESGVDVRAGHTLRTDVVEEAVERLAN